MRKINGLAVEWWRCAKCQGSFLVNNDDEHCHLLKKTMRCPNYVTCKGSIVKKTFTAKTSLIPHTQHLTAIELFQATCGLGLPGERNCSPEETKKSLEGARIVKAHLEKAGDPKKAILVSLTLDSGKILHLSSSTMGAIVFKVTDVD